MPTDTQVDEALAKLHAHWNNLLSTYAVRSSDEKLDRMVNIWNQYQCMVTFNMSRSASYYESGTGRGMGFRDSCQDSAGLCAPHPRPRPRAYSGHRRHTVPRRQRLPPVPAADQKGQHGRWLRLQR